MIDEFKLWKLPREKPLTVRYGPARGARCVIRGCPTNEHSYAVRLPNGAGWACTNCAADKDFQLDWSTV